MSGVEFNGKCGRYCRQVWGLGLFVIGESDEGYWIEYVLGSGYCSDGCDSVVDCFCYCYIYV